MSLPTPFTTKSPRFLTAIYIVLLEYIIFDDENARF